MNPALPFHSVTLDSERCVGCTTCLKKCPTEAIRVRKGKARIIDGRCIDCGECIRTCPHGAKKAISDPLSVISGYRIKVALPAPALFAQFEERFSIDRVLSALLALGFDEVFEVAEAADYVTEATRFLAKASCLDGDASALPRPIISSACPAVVKLIQVRYPSLLPHLAPVISPMEVAARIVKERIHAGEEGVGVFFVSPCAGKVTISRAPLGYARSSVDGVIGIKDLYVPLRNALAQTPERRLSRAKSSGLQWGRTEGEAEALGERRSISVDGIANVIGLLEALENGKLKDVAFIEANACPAGCVGGPLIVENPFIARTRLRNRAAACVGNPSRESLSPEVANSSIAPATRESLMELGWTEAVKARSSLALDADMLKAMIMMEEMDQLVTTLPGLDCGSCGAPSCQALAEDIVRGKAVETDCIFKLRENVRELAGRLLALEELKPPGLDR